MERKRINSSKIQAAGYDEKTRTLELEFSDGRIVAYAAVSPEIPSRRRAFLAHHPFDLYPLWNRAPCNDPASFRTLQPHSALP